MSTETLLDLHNVMAWVMVATNALAGSWALAAHWVERAAGPGRCGRSPAWPRRRSSSQVLIGVTLSSAKDLEAPEFHEFYGFVALIAAALIFSYRPQVKAYTSTCSTASAASSSWASASGPSTSLSDDRTDRTRAR